MLNKRSLLYSALSLACLSATSLQAHFPWMVRGEDGKATYFFGENLAERTYKLPPSIAAAELKMLNVKGDLAKSKQSKSKTIRSSDCKLSKPFRKTRSWSPTPRSASITARD